MEKVTIRLCGSSYIRDMELNDRYKVVNDSLWISLLSLVGNPDGTTVSLGEDASQFLKMDLEKRLEWSLEEKPADFLVVDMCYTAGHGLYRWKDQVFTKNPQFVKSEFLAEHEPEMEYIDVMRDREFDWKPYMDRFMELIGKYFDQNHIILVKSRCTDWYVTHTHVRKLKRKSKRAYNRRIKELEDYFIEKMNPYVIDIYSHYYISYSQKSGIVMSSYEKPFYHHAKRLVSTIIRTQPEQRIFTGQEYYMRLGRFIKYYDNLYAKNNVALFMDDSNFLDHLVLQLSREVLTEYESDFVEIEKQGYASIGEILEKYNFRFAASLRECLKAVQAVEQGDVFREGVQYETIFEFHLKILDRFTALVREEMIKSGLAAENNNINQFNVCHYYAALCAERQGRASSFKKYILELCRNNEEGPELKHLFKETRRTEKNAVRAGIAAMEQYYEPIQVDLWGSCITREILNEDKGRFRIGKYAYRNCFLFAFDDSVPYDDGKFEDLSLFENSSWRVGYIKSAFHKDLPEQLRQSGSKWLLLDFYDLVCDIVLYRGGVLTADSEVRGLKFFKEIKDDCTVTSVDEVFSEDEIRKRFDIFIRFIKERYGENIVFIRADVKKKFLTVRRRLRPLKGYTEETLTKKKKFLNYWQDYFEQQLDCYVVDYARQYYADDLCVSGAFMVHYEKEFYEKGYKALYEIMYKGDGKRRYE